MTSVRTSALLVAALGLAACVDPPITEGPDASVEPDADADDPQVSLPDDPAAIEALVGGTCAPRSCTANECGMVDDGCRAQMWCGECTCGVYNMSCEKALTQIWEHTLTAGTYTIEVTAISPTSIDPVLHVINSAGTESAFDDNSAGGTRPKVTVTVPSGQTRIVVIRPKFDTPSGGVATVTINGAGYIFGVRGRRQEFYNVRQYEEIETIQLPGNTAIHTIYGMSADGAHITQRVTNNGTAGGAVLTQPSTVSSRVFWMGTGTNAQLPTHLIRNDRQLSGHDVEPNGGDGLGYELEAALGLCSTLSGYATYPKDGAMFPCNAALDARDTDGDGLSDGIEVRGIRWGGHQPLRRWGANPRHKDMFVEIDSLKLSATDNPPKMSPTQARYFADVYGDRILDLTETQRGQHAWALRNPDNKPGISAHLDIGIAPESPADATVYGNWGGNNQVAPGATALEAWKTQMTGSRIATFRYSLLWNGQGGSTSTGGTCPGCGSYAWGSSNGTNAVNAHESGHAQGMTHSGPAGNHAQIDANCKPGHPSIMNYAYQEERSQFADGTGLGTLNNTRLVETGALNLGNIVDATRVLQMLGYRVDANGNVDWNRDGVFQPANTPVRAYSNFDPGNGCEFTRYNAQSIGTSMNTPLSPAIARLGNKTFLFSPGQTTLRYVSTTDDLDCPLGTAACGSFTGPSTFAMDVTRGVDVARVSGPGGRFALLVVGADSQGWLNSAMLLDDGTWTAVQWTGIWGVTPNEPAVEVMPDGRALLLFRQSDGTVLYGVHRYDGNVTGTWEQWGPAQTCAIPPGPDGNGGVPATNLMQAAGSSPGLARTQFTGIGPRIWGLFSTTTNLYIRSYDAAAQCFRAAEVPLDVNPSQFWPISGRPVGVWQPDANNAMGGRLTILGTTASADPNTRYVQQMWSYAQAPGDWRIGEKAGFDSLWTWGLGVDAWFDPGIDDNLRAVWTMSSGMGAANAQRLRFFPRADGINDFDQLPYDDLAMLRYAVCENVVDPWNNNASSLITCPPRPYPVYVP